MRMLQVNSDIKKLVSKIIDTELNNTNISGLITVQDVKTAPDFSHSKVFVSILGSKSKKNTLEALNKSKGYVRTRIAKELNYKKTPSVEFFLDEVIERGERVDALIDQISKERQEKEKNSESN